MKPSIERTLSAIGHWMEKAHNGNSSYSRQQLFHRYQDLVAIVAQHADVMPTEADTMLRKGYLGRWIRDLIDQDEGPAMELI